jgi:hypothetical protein
MPGFRGMAGTHSANACSGNPLGMTINFRSGNPTARKLSAAARELHTTRLQSWNTQDCTLN